MANQSFFKEKMWSFIAGMGSATIMLLAFFIPSLQDQWDRYQYRKIVDQYEQIGDEFFDEGRYDLAEQSFSKADTFSDGKRIDIEIKRLYARVNTITSNPNWVMPIPAGLRDADFEFLIHMLKGKENDKKRAAVLNSYGKFLANSKSRLKDAQKTFKDALKIDTTDELIYINFGNLLDQEGKKNDAKKMYMKAISLDNENEIAHYNLGLLLVEEGKTKEAKKEFEKAIMIDPEDKDAKTQYNNLSDINPK